MDDFPIPKPKSKGELTSTVKPKSKGELTEDELTSTVKPKSKGELTEDETAFILSTTLKPKHKSDRSIMAFIDSFVRCKSISQASAEAGVDQTIGYRYRHRSDISLAIQKIIDKSATKYGFDASEIFERVKEVVEFDPIEMQNPDGTFKTSLADIRPEARRNLKKLRVRNTYTSERDINGMGKSIITGEIIEYEFYDKLKAAELVGKEKDMFKNTTKVEHALTKDMHNILLDSARRADDRARNIIDVTPIKGGDND